MTDEEKRAVQEATRWECARIAALESHYWAEVDDERPMMMQISMGAMGAAANISGAIFMGTSADQFELEISNRKNSSQAVNHTRKLLGIAWRMNNYLYNLRQTTVDADIRREAERLNLEWDAEANAK